MTVNEFIEALKKNHIDLDIPLLVEEYPFRSYEPVIYYQTKPNESEDKVTAVVLGFDLSGDTTEKE